MSLGTPENSAIQKLSIIIIIIIITIDFARPVLRRFLFYFLFYFFNNEDSLEMNSLVVLR